MKSKLILIFFFFGINLLSWSQCVVVGTAMPQPASCSDACDGSIVYMYQNTNMASPGSPYIVILMDSDNNTLSFTTYVGEINTILFEDLCPDTYSITVQGSSCSNTTYATVAAPAPVVVSVNTTDPSFGLNNGAATIVATGGTSPYLYSINGGMTYQISNTFTGLAAGTYTATVLDDNGCIQEVDFTLTDNTACNIVVTANPTSMVMCYGACNGSLVYNYVDFNLNAPYTIELIQGSTTLQVATNASPNGTGTFTNLCAGVYTVEVTDASGCSGSYLVTLTQPTPLTIGTVTTTDATAGSNNGSATVVVTGGWPVYQYSLDGTNWQSSSTFTGLAAGIYVAYVMDNAGCINQYSFVINQDPGCFFNVTAIADAPSCAWACDGSINYIFAGTATDPVFSITLENSSGLVVNSATSPNQTVSGYFTNLCAGDYVLTVMNSSGCYQTANITVDGPDQLILTATASPASPGSSNGAITALVSGGTAPYSYSINGGTTWQSSPNFTGLAAGAYIVMVEDANGCTAIYTIVVSETAGCNFFLTANAFSTSCYGICNGSAVFGFNDPANNPPYTIELVQSGSVLQSQTISFSNGGTGTFTNLCEGVYTIVVTDDNGCSDSESIYVDSPDLLTVTDVSVTNASAGMSNGIATVNVSGGTAPYQFSNDNGLTWQSSNIFTGLDAGVYILWVEDANGCSTIYCYVVNEDPGCSIVTTLFLNQPVSCYGACDGVLAYAYTEGVSNPPYTINLLNNGTIVNSSTQTTPSFNGVFSGLCAGNYSLQVVNGDGCNSYVSNTILTEPSQIIIEVAVSDASTGNSNGVAEVLATGGTGQYQYSLNGIDYQSSNVFDTLSAGVYVAYVQDENGCQSIYTFLVDEDASCNIVVTATPGPVMGCAGSCSGTINFAFSDINSNPPYVVTLEGDAGVVSTQTFTGVSTATGVFTNVCSGTYVVVVTDADGCQSYYSVMVNTPDYLQVAPTWINATAGNNDGSINLNITGGTPPYQYSTDNQLTWNTGTQLTNLGAGFYIIFVKDAAGCMQVVCIILDDSNVIGMEDETTQSVTVYPNPTKGNVQIVGNNLENVYVTDISGKVVHINLTLTENGFLIDLSNQADGIYLIQVTNESGHVYTSRILKN